jgi:protein-S-isoprenylcysteine O-methyltransferase Ste14
VRHPGYSSLLLIGLGHALVAFTRDGWVRLILWPQVMRRGHGGGLGIIASLIFARVVLFWLLMAKGFWDRTRTEDEVLRNHFGKQWNDWAENVPYELLPGIY